MKLRKYSFTDSQWAAAKSQIQTTNDEGESVWDSSAVRTVVELGYLPTTPATYDAEGNELTPAVLSSKWSVDILWEGEPLASFASYEIWCPPMGVHSMGGLETIIEWTATCKQKHPEYFPEPTENV